MISLKARLLTCAALAAALAGSPSLVLAQALSSSQDSAYKFATSIPAGITSPDNVKTPIGTLNFFDGVPDQASTQQIYDNLDYQRAVQAYLLALPIVNQAANRDAILSLGPANITVPIWEELVDSRTVELTANNNTPYTWFWIDLHNGPVVVEAPPKVLGLADDMWYHWVGDIGFTGQDHGKGGKFLFLPPGYKGKVPDGYYIMRPGSYAVWVGWRSFLVDGNPKPGVDMVKAYMKIYPLGASTHAPKLKFVDLSGKPFNMVGPSGYQFWNMLNQVVQSEPTDTVDATTLGFWASIGIEKGKPFAPDARMKAILTEAAATGDATARALAYRVRDKTAYYYDNREWKRPFIGGYKFENRPGVANLDGAAMFFFLATGVTPAMDTQVIGEGSAYPWTAVDADGNAFDGSKTYKLHLPPHIPVKTFWSVIIYDTQTRSMLQTDQQYPSVSSQSNTLQVNADGSVDVYFAPKAQAGETSNWVQTIPGKSWFVLLRLYGPLAPWFDHSWRPDDIVQIK